MVVKWVSRASEEEGGGESSDSRAAMNAATRVLDATRKADVMIAEKRKQA